MTVVLEKKTYAHEDIYAESQRKEIDKGDG